MLAKQRVQLNSVAVMIITLLAVVIALCMGSHAFALDNAANTLKISPVRTDVEIAPGTSKTVKVTVTNLTSAPITVSPIENDFISGDEDGTPALILDANKYAPTHSLKRFMAPLANVTIPANQAQVVSVVITVPSNAQAGGYFGALRFAPASPDGGGQVNLSASVASLILLTVPGATVEKVTMTSFDIQQNGISGTSFNTPDNIQATVRFQNQGNVQIGPFGKVSVKNGDKVVYQADFNNKDPRDMILPDSARRWNIPLKNIEAFGHYTVLATFTYGKDNQTIDVSKSFWVIPKIAIFIAIAAVVVLIGLIVGIWFLIRAHRHRVSRRHGYGYNSSRRHRRR